MNSEPCAQPGANLMGSLRCLFDHNRSRLSRYRKKFWVVNAAQHQLEVYKNDQAHKWQHVVRACDIRNVVYARDKQNRFYMMIVQTRKNSNIRFRMNSSEEREEWYAAITKLADAYSTTNRRMSILYMIDRQCRQMSLKLKVRIEVEAKQLITYIPDKVFQYVLEAVDAVIANIAVVVRTYGADTDVPLKYTLFIDSCPRDSDRSMRDPQYDPTERSMTMNVVMHYDAPGNVSFTVTSAEEVLQLLQSDVFRNPLVEGWIANLPGCQNICQAIQDTLKTKNLGLTFKWGLSFKNNVNAELYLRSFVNLDFFKGIYHEVKEALSDVVELLERDGFTAELPGLFLDLLNPVGSSLMLKQRRRSSDMGAHWDVKATGGPTQAVGRSRKSGLPRNSTCENEVELPKLVLLNCAAGLISRNITGLAIGLQEKMVHECSHPPPLYVEHSLEYGQRLRPVLVLLSKYQGVFSSSLPDSSMRVSLRSQLFEVALHDLLYRKVMMLQSKMNQIFNKRVRVVIEWGQLLYALKQVGIHVAFKDFPSLVNGVSKFYLPRLRSLVGVLKHAPDAPSGGTTENLTTSASHPRNSLFEVFCQFVSLIRVNFTSFSERKTGFKIQEPRIVDGSLVDTLTCVKAEVLPDLLEVVKKSQPHPQEKSSGGAEVLDLETLRLLHNVEVCALTANLGGWCTGYFSVPEHHLLHHREPFSVQGDEFEGCGDSFTVHEPIPELNHGEVVANERSSEIRLFDLRRVINTVYDSQGDHVNLKIGTSRILQAIRSLSAAFKEKRIMKHDLVRVLVVNLHRLRQLYCNAVDGSTNMLLSEEKAEFVLKDFCEYEESETDILFLLRTDEKPNPGCQSVCSSVYYKYMASSHHTATTAKRKPDNRPSNVSSINLLSASSSMVRPRGFINPPTLPSSVKQSNDSLSGAGMFDPNYANNLSFRADDEETPSTKYTKRKYNFPTICDLALNYLLPREALLARRAWRTGFVFGLENVGKSLIINSLRGVVLPTVATIGLFQHIVSFNEWVFSLRELGGRESFRENWMYYRKNMKEVNFLVFVVDCMNSDTFGDAYRYLKSVTDYYNKIPLMVVFNNYQELPRQLTSTDLNSRINLNDIAVANPNREIITATCNVTIVHSSFRTIPSNLKVALRELSDVLLARCPEDLKPSMPKPLPEGHTDLSSPDYLINSYGVVLDHAGNVLRAS